MRSSALIAGVLVSALIAAPAQGGSGAAPEPDPGPTPGVVARANGTSVETAKRLLTDSTVRLTDAGRAFYVDAADPARESRAAFPTAQVKKRATSAFRLHSNPAAKRTIFLDFDGSAVSGTEWNSLGGVPNGFHVGWDPSNNGFTRWSNNELAAIKSIWARVAEDYAPYAVDVTTQQPPESDITRASRSDARYGTRVLVSDSSSAYRGICDPTGLGVMGCGGVAFINVFSAIGAAHSRHQPAWVFPAGLGNDVKAIAEATTHEAGHTLALEHDGGPESPDYDTGHGAWAPIMGASYDRPITQFSKGDYAGATNRQDDLTVISKHGIPLRRDEGAGKRRTARPIPRGQLVITTRDVDYYRLGRCSGRISVRAIPAQVSPNLDISLELFTNRLVKANNPKSRGISRDRAQGMSAAVSLRKSGNYVVSVDGVGNGTAVSGYDDYGSIGAYQLKVKGCKNAFAGR